MSDTFSHYSNPDFNRANQGTLQGIITQALRNAMVELEVMLPATVISYDRVANVASVQPQIMMVATDGTLISRTPLALVPVIAIGGGGFVLNFPQVAGGKGWIKAADRDISLYLQSGVANGPNTGRLHSFSDGLFIPDFGSGYTINSEDTDNAVLQIADGTIRIAIWSDRVKITGPNDTIVVGPNGTTITSTNRISIEGPRFDVNCAEINFASSPHIGPIPP